MKKTRDVIIDFRKRTNMSVAELAEKIGVSQVFLTKIENEQKKLSEKVFENLKEYLSENEINQIKDYEDYIKTPDSIKEELDELRKKSISKNNFSPSTDKLTLVELNYEIPVYSKVFAGPNGTLEYGEILEYVNIPSLRNGTEVIGIKVDGDSMEHTIPNGATILVKKDVEVNDNEIGVFIHDNTPYVKRLRTGEKELYLMSDNSKHLPITVREGDEFFTVGKVVEVMWKL